MIYLDEEGSMSQTFVMFIQGAVTIILNVSSMAGSIGGQTETLDTNPQSAWKRLLTMPFPYVMLLMFHQRLHFTPASNLGYLVPPQDNISWVPNRSLEPPGCETKVSSNNFWFRLFEIACFPWQPIANLRRGSAYKITHISAVTYHILLNLIPN